MRARLSWKERLLFRMIPYLVRLEGKKWDGTINGMPCMLRRHRRAGHWMAFVQVPAYHKLAQKSIGDCYATPQCLPRKLPESVASIAGDMKFWECKHQIQLVTKSLVHGGIIFAGTLKGYEGWWLGLDFGHSNDLSPATLRVLRNPMPGLPPYRTREYALAELKKLAHWVHSQSYDA